MKPGMKIVWLRRTVQTVSVLAFFYLIYKTDYSSDNKPGGPVEFFFQIDPLVLIDTWIAGGVIETGLLLGLVTLGITMLLGRFFCGWICPMGAIHNLVSAFRNAKKKDLMQSERWTPWQRWKYVGLVVLLVMGLAGFHITGWLDPLCVLERSVALSIYPSLNAAVVWVFTWLYQEDPVHITVVSEPIYEFLRAHVLLFKQTFFNGAGLIGLLFVITLLLNFYRSRFWCRYLCPLGALLGWAGRFTTFRLKNNTEKCGDCQLCVVDCQGAADPLTHDGWKASECFYCWNCKASCHSDAITFEFELPGRTFIGWLKNLFRPIKERQLNLERRTVLTAATGAAITGLAYASQPLRSGARYEPLLIRPPGALAEPDFQDRCIRCGACMKVCPTNLLQPAFLQAGLGGMWSPVGVANLGYCEYNCTLCGQVCPTGAIQDLLVEDKHKVKMGTAFFDPERCIPYAWQRDCIVCEEHCPTDPKAIWFEEKEVMQRDGTKLTVKLPHVDPEQCVGCGICQNKCPVHDKRGIRVSSVGETRHPDNQMFLEEGYY